MVQLKIQKQALKFSSGHFLILSDVEAERLHGHNYQVRLRFEFQPESLNRKTGFSVDFSVLKRVAKELCDLWDEHVLLPGNNPEMRIETAPGRASHLEVLFRDRMYVFPESEVCILPLVNTSVEALSQLFHQNLGQRLKGLLPEALWAGLFVEVEVEETAGQSGSYFAKFNT